MRARRLTCAAAAAAALALVPAAAAGALPGTSTTKDRAAWRAILHWPASCERDWREAGAPGTAGVDVRRTASELRLVMVACSLGAYQGTSMLYLVDARARPTGPLGLRIYEDPGTGKLRLATRTRTLGVMSFTRSSGLLEVFDKFRGLGDCGIYSTFRLRGRRFVPLVARAKKACDGKGPYDPRRWPRLPID